MQVVSLPAPSLIVTMGGMSYAVEANRKFPDWNHGMMLPHLQRPLAQRTGRGGSDLVFV